MTTTGENIVSSVYDDTINKDLLFALKVGEKFAILKSDPENTNKKSVTLFTKTGKKIVFKPSLISKGDKIVAFF